MQNLEKKYLSLVNWLTSSFNQKLLVLFLVGLILLGFGVLSIKNGGLSKSSSVEVLESTSESDNDATELVVEIAGAVEKPGVYNLPKNSRVEDLLIASGGISADADRIWVEKTINRAAKLVDGQKLYIPKTSSQSEVLSANYQGDIKVGQGISGSRSNQLININMATLKELDTLPGIGPVYGQNIIEHRPYSSVVELSSKSVLKPSTYEKIKDLVTTY